jgi:hypothetical protein
LGDRFILVAHKLSTKEQKRIERMAKRSDLHGLFAFFADFHQDLNVDRPVLIGSEGHEEILIEGFVPIRTVLQKLLFLDHVYNSTTSHFKTLVTQKRTADERSRLRAPIQSSIHRNWVKSFPRCCYLQGLSPCSGGIVHAHAIQQAQIRPYSKNGQVYSPNPLGDRNEGVTEFRLSGVNRVTTFRGFCAKHDSEVFRPIEVTPFAGTAEQLFLYHYRALCKDYHIRLASLNFFDQTISDFEKAGLGNQLKDIRFFREMTLLDLKEIPLGKSRLDLALQGGNFGDLSGFWMRGAGIPGLLLNTNLFPLRDFLGRPFPRRTSIALNNWVSLTITIENGLPLVIIAGQKNSPLLGQLLDSLTQIPRNRLAATLTCYALACSETPVIIPRWWENLTSESRRAARLTANARFFTDYFKGPFDWEFGTPTFF